MSNCVECIHKEICLHRANILNDTYAYLGIKYDTENCKYYTPTANVVEVKHGRWKIKCDDYDCEYMMCSVCKEEFYPADEDTVDTTPNYCMNCGAKMDKRSETE